MEQGFVTPPSALEFFSTTASAGRHTAVALDRRGPATVAGGSSRLKGAVQNSKLVIHQ